MKYMDVCIDSSTRTASIYWLVDTMSPLSPDDSLDELDTPTLLVTWCLARIAARSA